LARPEREPCFFRVRWLLFSQNVAEVKPRSIKFKNILQVFSQAAVAERQKEEF
jgi:hypothetical protein